MLKKAEARDGEIEKAMAHVNFHNDASDLEEWLEEKKASVQSVPTLATGSSPLEKLRQTRARIKKLGGIESELAANQKA